MNSINVLYAAVENGNLREVTTLLNDPTFQVDINSTSTTSTGRHQGTCLVNACSKGYNDIVKILIQHHANVTIKDNFGWTALHDAVEMNRIDVATTLLNHGAHVNADLGDSVNETPLMVAAGIIAESPCQRDMFDLLFKWGAVVDIENVFGMTALHMACRAAHTVAVECLVRENANLFGKDRDRLAPIHHACTNYNTHLWRRWANRTDVDNNVYLLGRREDDNTVDMTPIITLLLDNGVDVDSIGGNIGATPLYFAIQSTVISRVRLLLDRGASLTSKTGVYNRGGESIFKCAIRNNNKPILNMIQHEKERRDEQERREYEQKVRCREAVMMGLHERLGENSYLQNIEPDLIMQCIDEVLSLEKK
jgi:ankyrin repeat protein